MMGYTNANSLSSAWGNIGTGPSQTDDSGTGMRPDQESGGSTDTSNNQQQQQQQQQQQPVQQPNAWGQPQQWNWNLPQFGVPFQFPVARIGQVYLRFTAGIFISILSYDLDTDYVMFSYAMFDRI